MKRDIYRPLHICHAFGFDYNDSNTYEEKRKIIRTRIEELKAKGFGGIVTNVRNEHYMKDSDEWLLMREKVEICKELGLRMWLYDEDCYPSGAAGTQTLEKNPDFEARAVAMQVNIAAPGESLEINLPHGHEKLVAAVSYIIQGERPTDEELQHPYCRYNTLPIKLKNDMDSNLLILCFFQKRMYEGSHAQNNVAYNRRYIDVSNKDAVAAFIDNTYRRYTDTLKDSYAKYIGDENENSVIEAVFTDEPSYMGVYINRGIKCRQMIDAPDESIKLYPVVNWGRDVADRFASEYGYRLEEYLTALFYGHSACFCQVRHDYYKIMSDLLEQSFFAQLSDYCSAVGLNFSGHILLEDKIRYHVMFEGNFFHLLRHMHVPGIDMLWSTPQTVWNNAFTPLLVRSIADIYNRPHVMDEVSAHQHGGNVTTEQIYISLMLQFAFGVDIFTSYYKDNDETGEKKAVWDAVARVGEAMDGKRQSDTLLLYPIETMMRHRKPNQMPLENDYGYSDFRETEDDSVEILEACSSAMEKAQFAMLNAQKPFTYIDVAAAKMQPATKWKYFIIGACDVTADLAITAKQLSEGGCRIIWYCPKGSDILSEEVNKLPASTAVAATEVELIALIRPQGPALTANDGNTDGIAFAETECCAVLVNRDANDRQLCWRGQLKSICDAKTGKEIPTAKSGSGTDFIIPGTSALLLSKLG